MKVWQMNFRKRNADAQNFVWARQILRGRVFRKFQIIFQNLGKGKISCPNLRGSELWSYEIELQNGVTQNDITIRVTNSKMFIEILLSSH